METSIGDAEADRYLAALLHRAREVLGNRLVGVYVLNSGARGDYLAGRSDLDVAVIVGDQLDGQTKRAVFDALRHEALSCPAPRLELVVYRRAVASAPGSAPAFEVNLNTGPAITDHVTTDPADEPPHWFVLDLAVASERALRIAGPPPAEVFGAVPPDIVLQALADARRWHADHDTAEPNRVLNDCRAWGWIATGHWSSKSEAAAWAMNEDADADLIRHALERRLGRRADPLDVDRVEAFAGRVGAIVASAARAAR